MVDKMKTAIISLSGSLVNPKEPDTAYLKEFRKLIIDYVNTTGNRVIIVTGGGGVNRLYNSAARDITEIKDVDLDWIGIAATKINAQLVRSIFGELAYGQILDNPEDMIETDRKILVGSGHLPGHSSDLDAVLLAKTFSADTVINLSGIDYAYTDDPKKNPDAKPIEKTTWDEFQDIVGTEWSPKLEGPFDPIATKNAKGLGLKLIIANGKKIDNLKIILEGKDRFIGTLVSQGKVN